MHTLPRVKQTPSGNLLCSTGSSAQGSVMTQMGGMGVGGTLKKKEIYVYLWLIHLLYGRNQHNIVKQLSLHFKSF